MASKILSPKNSLGGNVIQSKDSSKIKKTGAKSKTHNLSTANTSRKFEVLGLLNSSTKKTASIVNDIDGVSLIYNNALTRNSTDLQKRQIHTNKTIPELKNIIQSLGLHLIVEPNAKKELQLKLLYAAVQLLKNEEHIPNLNLDINYNGASGNSGKLMSDILAQIIKQNIKYSNLSVATNIYGDINIKTLNELLNGLLLTSETPSTIDLSQAWANFDTQSYHKLILDKLDNLGEINHKTIKLHLPNSITFSNPPIEQYISLLAKNKGLSIDCTYTEISDEISNFSNDRLEYKYVKNYIQCSLKYVEECEKQGIPISKIGFTNEYLQEFARLLKIVKSKNLGSEINIDKYIQKYSTINTNSAAS